MTIRKNLLFLATEWGTGEGGINSFNCSLARAVAKIAPRSAFVFCTATNYLAEAIEDAEQSGIILIEAKGDCDGNLEPNFLQEIQENIRKRTGRTEVDAWIGHDVKTGPLAIDASKKMGGRPVLIHHMNYKDYQNIEGGNGEKATINGERQSRLFSTDGAHLFAVGTELAENIQQMTGREAQCIVPGFHDVDAPNSSSNKDLRAITFGRYDKSTDPLKRFTLAVEAFGEAAKYDDGSCNGHLVSSLENPWLSVIGLSKELYENKSLEKSARARAGRFVNVVPAGYRGAEEVRKSLASANLAIMLSMREGFGLSGWEAIGAGVPLLLSKDTGLYKFIDSALGGSGTGCLKEVTLRGDEHNEKDVSNVAKEILSVSKDVTRAKNDALSLRSQIVSKFGGTWERTAEDFIRAIFPSIELNKAPQVARRTGAAARTFQATPSIPPAISREKKKDGLKCAKLTLSDVQGSLEDHLSVHAELRMGASEHRSLFVDVDVMTKRIKIKVQPIGGRITSRLGEDYGECEGIKHTFDGEWTASGSEARPNLEGKILGDEVLCGITGFKNGRLGARVDVSVSRGDLDFKFSSQVFELIPLHEKMIKIILLKRFFNNWREKRLILDAITLGRAVDND